jgi:hypothetical protein
MIDCQQCVRTIHKLTKKTYKFAEFSMLPQHLQQPPHEYTTAELGKGFGMLIFGAVKNHTSTVTQEPDGEEDDNYKHLTTEMWQIYSHTPRIHCHGQGNRKHKDYTLHARTKDLN